MAISLKRSEVQAQVQQTIESQKLYRKAVNTKCDLSLSSSLFRK